MICVKCKFAADHMLKAGHCNNDDCACLHRVGPIEKFYIPEVVEWITRGRLAELSRNKVLKSSVIVNLN